VELRTTSIVAIEALARWQTADGVLGPDSFLHLFGTGHLMRQLFDRMLDSGLHFLAEYRHRLPDLSVAVNFEFAGLPDDGLADLVAMRLGENDIDPERVTIELNDRLAYDLTPAALEGLAAVAALGVKLVLDDVATTFEVIKRLPGVPIAGAKLDRSHVKQIATGEHEQEVVRRMLARAADANIEVIAEGVETQAQCDRLIDLGCNFGQGYLFAVPQPSSSLAAMLDAPLMNSW
jgi:EAL domain-containing protein (putative c-di-GMP-specific phosphodiesterase class I)